MNRVNKHVHMQLETLDLMLSPAALYENEEINDLRDEDIYKSIDPRKVEIIDDDLRPKDNNKKKGTLINYQSEGQFHRIKRVG